MCVFFPGKLQSSETLISFSKVFIEGLRTAEPPIIREPRLSEYIDEVFGNLRDILFHHKRMLAALFARQRDQHPLIQSVADIILDSKLIYNSLMTLLFM